MNGRRAAGIGAVAGVAAVAALAALGTLTAPDDTATASGWTGHVDPASVSDRAAMTPDDASAVALLARSAAAAGTVAYAGRALLWDRGRSTETVLVHVPGRGTLVRAASAPESSARLTADGRSDSFADDGRLLALLRVNYRVVREADLDTRVAGRPADAVLAIDADGHVAARYWLDHATGLLLRRELVGSDGVVWSRTGFTALRLGVPTGTRLPAAAADPWGAALTSAGLTSARASGCPCPDALPGGLSLLETRAASAGVVADDAVVHQLFSDGLVTASLFSMAGTLGPDNTAGLAQRGFTQQDVGGAPAWVRGATAGQPAYTVVWASRGEVLTLVTDDAPDPQAVAAAVVAALPPDAPAPAGSLWDRLVRGWHWVTGARS